MKKHIDIMVALVVTLFLMTIGMKSQAQAGHCKFPWQQIYDTVLVQGCEYEIDICIWCKPNLPGEVKFNTYRNIGTCLPNLTEDQIVEQILSQISTLAYFWFGHCQFDVPPCTGKARAKIEWDIPLCWKLKLMYIDPIDPLNKNQYLGIPCEEEDSYCRVTYSYCKDQFNVVHNTQTGYYGYNFPPDCEDTEGYEITKPVVLFGESECYIYHSLCNP